MLLSVLMIAGPCAVLGSVGGLLGRDLLSRWFDCTITHRPDLIWAYRRRSLIIGLLAAAGLLLLTYSPGTMVDFPFVLLCSTVSFVSALLYVSAWIQLAIKLGTGPLQTCELSLFGGVVLLSLLYVCGILWITLVIVGVCTVVGGGMAGGLLAYRCR